MYMSYIVFVFVFVLVFVVVFFFVFVFELRLSDKWQRNKDKGNSTFPT